jgi:three-Cys-motif partner protein
VSDAELRFDEIGIWSELKLKIVQDYGSAYTRAFANEGRRLKKYYIDAYSGPGVHISKATQEQVEGSPARALKIVPKFDHYYFIDIREDKTEHLERLCGERPDVTIYTEDSGPLLTQKILPSIQYEKYNRALCLLDPYGLHLDWQVMEQAGHSRAIDMFLNFPVMDMNRNAIWRNPERIPRSGIDRMTKFWGDDSWRKAAYVERRQQDLFKPTQFDKQSNDAIVAAFRERLRKVAGFNYVPEPLPMKNKMQAVIYYLFLASPKLVAAEIIEGIFSKYR